MAQGLGMTTGERLQELCRNADERLREIAFRRGVKRVAQCDGRYIHLFGRDVYVRRFAETYATLDCVSPDSLAETVLGELRDDGDDVMIVRSPFRIHGEATVPFNVTAEGASEYEPGEPKNISISWRGAFTKSNDRET